MQNNNFENRI